MNLLKELAPYSAEINAHIRGFGMSNKEVAGKLVDIWDEWKNIPEISKQIYGSVKNIPKTDKGCSGCVSDAIKNIVNWKKHLEKTSYYKLVPEGSKSKKKVNPNPKKLTPKKEGKEQPKRTIKTDIKVVNPELLKWGELKTYAKAKGINTAGMKKPDILKALKK
jgi:hypothetical protein